MSVSGDTIHGIDRTFRYRQAQYVQTVLPNCAVRGPRTDGTTSQSVGDALFYVNQGRFQSVDTTGPEASRASIPKILPRFQARQQACGRQQPLRFTPGRAFPGIRALTHLSAEPQLLELAQKGKVVLRIEF